MHQIRALYFALVFVAAPLCLARDLAVIVNDSNATSAVTPVELGKLLKTDVRSWPNGKKVEIFLTDPTSADTRTILGRVYKMKPEEIRSLADAHKADIQLVSSDDIILTMVANKPGALGIVNVYSINSHVKVLKVDDKLPLEQGYLLHGN